MGKDLVPTIQCDNSQYSLISEPSLSKITSTDIKKMKRERELVYYCRCNKIDNSSIVAELRKQLVTVLKAHHFDKKYANMINIMLMHTYDIHP